MLKRQYFETVFASARKKAAMAALSEVRAGATADAIEKVKSPMQPPASALIMGE